MQTFIFDLDGVIATEEKGKYENAKPFKERIIKINQLYERGNKIIIDSARGTLTKKDHYALTEKQLKEWGVKYHILRTGVKFFGHYYIDDKAINIKDFF